MHELAICQALMKQVNAIAHERNARGVTSITLAIGPLAGVEADLLRHAFPLATAGSIARGAQLIIETTTVIVHCNQCNTDSEVSVNRLLCRQCNNWQTTLVSGDELLLKSLELELHDSSREMPVGEITPCATPAAVM